jgi:hypothetical protein
MTLLQDRVGKPTNQSAASVAECTEEPKLFREALIALALGMFIVVTRFERLFLISLFLVPLILRREWMRVARTGSLAQTGLVLGIVFAVALGAAAVPKHPDSYLDELHIHLPSRSITLAGLNELGDAHLHILPGSVDETNAGQKVYMTSTEPTLRELVSAIQEQTNLRPSLPTGSGKDATILWGIPWPRYVRLSKAPARALTSSGTD